MIRTRSFLNPYKTNLKYPNINKNFFFLLEIRGRDTHELVFKKKFEVFLFKKTLIVSKMSFFGFKTHWLLNPNKIVFNPYI